MAATGLRIGEVDDARYRLSVEIPIQTNSSMLQVVHGARQTKLATSMHAEVRTAPETLLPLKVAGNPLWRRTTNPDQPVEEFCGCQQTAQGEGDQRITMVIVVHDELAGDGERRDQRDVLN